MVPHVIIVGGGFGGVSAARALRGALVRATLIDKRNYHLFRPHAVPSCDGPSQDFA
jgi:NADH:ubiquinone reductase (H+-translocating)